MPLKLLTLNIEGDRHLERVCNALARHSPDIVCLQEVFEADCGRLAATGPYQVKYSAQTCMDAGNAFHGIPRGNWGIAVLTKVSVQAQTIVSYADDPAIRAFRRPNDPRRAVIVTALTHHGQQFRIATTHFTWSPEGRATDEQRDAFWRLESVMRNYPDYVLCGDFNAPRGGEVFALFTTELALTDHLPASIVTTIDAEFHRAGALELVVDTVFSTPGYNVGAVQVLDGLSDHKGVLASISRNQHG